MTINKPHRLGWCRQALSTILGCVWLSILALPASASVNLDRTRMILEGTERSVSIMAVNGQAKPYLLQSWVETEGGEKMSGPLLALPPLQRIEPNGMALVQVTSIGAESTLVQDRESLFYLNVLEVPPKSERDNVLQIAFQSRLKLFYRPKGLSKGTSMPWQRQMTIRVLGPELVFDNPTPYHIVIATLGDSEAAPFAEFSELVLKPYSSTTYQAPRATQAQVYLRYMDDFGGARPLTYDCRQSSCQLMTPEEDTK
ncbi:MAG: fimbria/pilus periplasmic chaperone [Neisseriaceae bacterium]|nr:fimbria/pilus periplasmic chaperone [Neisseriaceae bacterium]